MRYLGLIIDDNLTWRKHIEILSKDIARPVGVMHKLKYRLKESTLKLIYHSLIHSKLFYMINAWGSAKQLYKKQLYVLQNRALKSIHKLPIFFSTSSLYGSVAKDILPIESIYKKSLLTFVQQCRFDAIHHTMTFETIQTRTTRATTNGRLKTPKVRTERYGRESIRYRACTYFNNLPPAITRIRNIFIFKKQIRPYLISI